MIFEHGSIVLAKLKGFPWWPAKIEKENKIPEHILKKKPKHQNTIPVKFFGTNDYGFVNKKDIKQFDMNKAKDMIKKKTNKKLVESDEVNINNSNDNDEGGDENVEKPRTGYGVRSIKKESDVNADNSSSDKKPIIRARRTYKRSVNNKDQSVNDDKNTSNNKSPGKIGNDDDDKNAVTDNHKQEVDGDKEMVNSDQQDDKQEVNGDQNVSNEVKINNSSNNNYYKKDADLYYLKIKKRQRTGYGVRSIKKESDVNADNSSSDKKPIIRARRTYKRSVNNKDQSVNDDKNTSNNKSPGKIGNDDDDKNAVTDNHKQEVDGDKEMVNSDQQDDKQEVNGDQNVSNEVKINNSSNNNVNVNDENDKKPGTHRTFRTTNKRSSKNDETITAINDNKEREGEGKQDGIDKKPAARVSRINK
ncbi:8829_t:CDS:2, partial [Entrophospora sp. SA101]